MRWPWSKKPVEWRANFQDTNGPLGVTRLERGGPLPLNFDVALNDWSMAAAGVYARAFAASRITGDAVRIRALTPRLMHQIGAQIIRPGASLFFIRLSDTTDQTIELIPAQTWKVHGGPGRSTWRYRFRLGSPDGLTAERTVPDSAVIFLNWWPTLSKPWQGDSPHRSFSSQLAAKIDKGLAAEASVPPSRLIQTATTLTPDQSADFSAAVAAGGIVVIPAEPGDTLSFSVRAIKPEPSKELLDLRDQCRRDFFSSLGLAPGLFDGSISGLGLREHSRTFRAQILEPLGAILQGELAEKLDDPTLEITFPGLGQIDVQSKARAVKALVDSGVAPDKAMSLAGFGAN